VVRLPKNAKLYFDGKPAKLIGPEREFLTPPLKPGNEYSYELKAEVPSLGMVLCQTKKVKFTFRAGEPISVRFPDPAEAVLDRLAKEERKSGDKVGKGDLAGLRKLYEQWKRDNDETAWEALAKAVADLTEEREILSAVMIKTVDNNYEERRGLTVYYRFTGR